MYFTSVEQFCNHSCLKTTPSCIVYVKTGRGLSDMSMTSFQLHRLYYYTAIYTMLYIFRQSRRSGHPQDTFSWCWPPRHINNRKQETAGGNRDSLLEAKEPITTSGKSHRQQQQQQPKERGPRKGGRPSSVWQQAAAAATAEAHTPAVVTSADIQRALCRIPW